MLSALTVMGLSLNPDGRNQPLRGRFCWATATTQMTGRSYG